jgi:hypothetical protein
LGLALIKIPNSSSVVNKWLQETQKEVKKVYDGAVTTKEGAQLGLYENYNFSGFDCIGVTFYPFSNSTAKDPYTNITYAGVENLEEYEKVVKQEIDRLQKLEKKFKINSVILGKIGIDVVNGKFIANDKESKKIRAEAYEIVLRDGFEKIDGFFFSKFEPEDEELNRIFKDYLKAN